MAFSKGFAEPEMLPEVNGIPDVFSMSDGTKVMNADDWVKRAEELRAMYEFYMYGVWRDGSDEKLDYSYRDGALTLNIVRKSTGASASFTATVKLPNGCLESGWPVIVGMHANISENRALESGIATITIDGYSHAVASDDMQHIGAFYDLYPYGEEPSQQTGVLMAWAWGCSKILDALEAGLADELGISTVNTIVTGVSRWGKAALVCGAFDRRFKVTAPSCSGAGGAAMFRYVSEGRTYDFSDKGGPAEYTYSANEPLSCLQSDAECGWFNDRFRKISSPERIPFDQHMLCSLAAEPGRYLFIIASCIGEDWVNAPAMWMSFLGARRVFAFLGIEDNIAINVHKEGHAVIPEDIDYLAAYLTQIVCNREGAGSPSPREDEGTAVNTDIADLKTSVFELEANYDPAWNIFA